MSNDKQSSSVEWLVEILGKYNEEMVFLYQNEIEQAKAMHKEETIKLYYAYEDYVLREEGIIKTFGQFYNETFGGNNEQQ
jgi:hypothetical protein